MGEITKYYPLGPDTDYPLSKRDEPKHSLRPGPPGKKIVRIETAGGKVVHEHEVIDLDQKPPKNPTTEEQILRRRAAKEEYDRKRRLKANRRRS